jgi:hypothetical protein
MFVFSATIRAPWTSTPFPTGGSGTPERQLFAGSVYENLTLNDD